MKVCKFGGSSVASAEQIRRVISIVSADPARRVVVVSAPGKRSKDDAKVTDMLISCADCVLNGGNPAGEIAALSARFESIREGLGLEAELVEFVQEELARRLATPASAALTSSAMNAVSVAKFLDSIKALGEEFSARFCAAAFCKAGIPARFVDPRESGMLVSEEFGNARLLPEAPELLREFIAPQLDAEIVVYPGFFGYTRGADVATFSRGGSDITGAILAAALGAECYENFTDVDSVYPVDPRIVPEVRRGIAQMTYREMRELSYAGFGVFHDEAVLPAIRASIPINIRNTNRPEEPGTLVLPTRKTVPGRVIGIASTKGFGTILVAKYLMNREVGFVAKILAILSAEGLPFEHLPTGVDSVSIILRDSLFTAEMKEKVFARIRAELEPDEISYKPGLAIMMVVGEGMRMTVGTCTRITGILSAAGVNIEMINQGSSEISIMFGVSEGALETAVRALYAGLFPN